MRQTRFFLLFSLLCASLLLSADFSQVASGRWHGKMEIGGVTLYAGLQISPSPDHAYGSAMQMREGVRYDEPGHAVAFFKVKDPQKVIQSIAVTEPYLPPAWLHEGHVAYLYTHKRKKGKTWVEGNFLVKVDLDTEQVTYLPVEKSVTSLCITADDKNLVIADDKGSILVSPMGKSLRFSPTPWQGRVLFPVEREKIAAIIQEGSAGIFYPTPGDLSLLDVEKMKKSVIISNVMPGMVANSPQALRPDHARILAAAYAKGESPEDAYPDLYEVDLKTLKRRKILEGVTAGFIYSPDGEKICGFTSRLPGKAEDETVSVLVYDLKRSKVLGSLPTGMEGESGLLLMAVNLFAWL